MTDEQTTNQTKQAATDADARDSQTTVASEPQAAGPEDSVPLDSAQEASGQPQTPVTAPAIGDLLAEYDEAAPLAKAPDTAATAALEKATGESDGAGGTDSRIGALIEVVRAQELERLQAREDADAQKVLTDAKQAIAEFADKVPEDFAERWLIAEYQLNSRLHAAWARRHESQAAMAQAERAVERAMNDLYKAVQNVPETEANTDQEAVAAALGGASATQPKPGAPDYGRMSDGEFRKSVEDEHGYTPGV